MSISDKYYIAIQRWMYRYAQCADRKDYEGFAAVFVEMLFLTFRVSGLRCARRYRR